MSKKSVRVSVSVVVLLSALSWLMFTTISEGAEYYKMVDEVVAAPEALQGKRLQVHGYVRGVPSVNPKTLEYRFQMHNNGQVISAVYTGLVPDTFKEDAEVVVKGRLGEDGVIHIERDGIMAKCPSKYEAEGGGPSIR
ncbi:MAG: cytochrome c maturation protein CcmE [Acidobacteria bacterium]|nr:cytochrome c maturation protein CcmE [Acidobacteriota bacterium]